MGTLSLQLVPKAVAATVFVVAVFCREFALHHLAAVGMVIVNMATVDMAVIIATVQSLQW